MSFNLRNIREVSNDPLAKFTNQIAKQLSAFLTKDQIDALEDQEDIYADGQDIDTVVKFHDELESTAKFDTTTLYYPPFEPDNDKLKVWVRGVSLGNTMRDYSLQGNTISLLGDPLLMDGTFNDGSKWGGTKSTCLRFNRPTSDFINTEYISIPDSVSLQVSGISTGISYFCRFRIQDLATQGGVNRTIYEKIDDSTPSDAAMIQVSSDGRIIFHVKRSGTEYNNQTAASTIAVNTVYDLWCTYANSGNTVHIYVNNSDKTLTAPSSPTWHATLTNHDASIFRKGLGTSGGYVYGDLYDFRVYREKVVSSTEVGYLNTNKWTIADIPYGQVGVANYSASNP